MIERREIMAQEADWVFIVKKRLSWISEMLQIVGTDKRHFKDSLDVDFEFRNARMLLFHEFLDSNELQRFDAMVVHQLQKDPDFLHRVAQRSYQRCHQFTKLGEDISKEDWAEKSDKELLTYLSYFHQEALLMIPVIYFEPNTSESIRHALLEKLQKKNQAEKLDEYFLLLTSTMKELTIIKEQRDLLTIGATIQEHPTIAQNIRECAPEEGISMLPTSIVAKLEQHINDYAWINTDDIFGRPWNTIDLVTRLRHLLYKDCRSRLQAAKQRQIQRERQREHIIEELPVDGELLKLVEAARENSHLRTYRTEVYVRTLYQASQLIGEVAKRVGLTYEDALYLSIEELIKASTSHRAVSQRELSQRKSGMAYVMINRNLKTFFGSAARKLADRVGLFEKPFAKPVQLEGTIANTGVVRGIVKVLHDISELDKVEDGDILVASMTIPEFVPAMERAAAFVTDEGGITCHAAIISREMDVPCIIGVEIATKVLQDGDFVEVDANNGFVKLLHALNSSN
jgi:phosphohistidine swiveling domain-containing protein